MAQPTELMETSEQALNQISGGRVLDVATGVGGFITFLIEKLKNYTDITGIDSNERPLEAARKTHSLETIHFQCMDAARMDFPDCYFDTVCMANSMHHMADLSRVFSEMRRVCKPGGHLIISEMYQDGQSETQLTHVLLHHWWAAVDIADGISHHETFTRQQIMELTGKLGLQHQIYFNEKDLESDPRDPEIIRELDGVIDRYIQRSQALIGGAELCQRGEVLRQRVNVVGFQGASSLFMIGEK
jgi:ubiquinone/menaquinone biosynthesis C-methylase UbiE